MPELKRDDGRNLSRPIPERIREAREAAGFSLEAFADALEISKQAVSRFESGLSSPSGETMRRIIGVTGQPPAFFVSSRSRAASGIRPFWRSLQRMRLPDRKRIARRLEWASDVVDFLVQFVDLPEVDLPVIEFDPESTAMEQVERAADTLREAWSLGRGPIRDLSAIMEHHGFMLVRESVNCSDMDAVSCWQGGRPFVLFSADVESGPRNTFNIAHELGHILLHSDVELTKDNLPQIERQAHRFASALLMPQETFSREVLGSSIDHFLFLKEKWGVSIAAMAYRCKDLEIFTSNQHSYVMRQINARSIREREPLDERFKVREPSVLGASVRMLLEHRVQSVDQIERALALNLEDIESLCGLPKGHLDTRVIPFQPRLK